MVTINDTPSTNDQSKPPATTDAGSNKAKSKKKQQQEPPPEMNPKFKDVQETGKWGDISKGEVYIAVTIGVLVVVGVAVGLALGLKDDDNDPAPSQGTGGSPTLFPTEEPARISIEEEFVLAFQAIDVSDFTYLYQSDMPSKAEDYVGLLEDPTASPQERAMSWLLYEDSYDTAAKVGERWALASLYYTWNGDNWTSADGWLSSDSECTWEHVYCDSFGKIRELDLSNNNLVGTIPNEIVMLNFTQSIWLRENQLSGTIPNEALGSMPRLSILYLDNNHLTGTISVALRDNEVLSK